MDSIVKDFCNIFSYITENYIVGLITEYIVKNLLQPSSKSVTFKLVNV